MKATRPLEYFCFGSFALPENLDSKLFAFIAIDLFSKKEYLLDICSEVNGTSTLENLKMFLENDELEKVKASDFTIIFYDNCSVIQKDIEKIIKPYNGTCKFDTKFVDSEVYKITSELENAFNFKKKN